MTLNLHGFYPFPCHFEGKLFVSHPYDLESQPFNLRVHDFLSSLHRVSTHSATNLINTKPSSLPREEQDPCAPGTHSTPNLDRTAHRPPSLQRNLRRGIAQIRSPSRQVGGNHSPFTILPPPPRLWGLRRTRYQATLGLPNSTAFLLTFLPLTLAYPNTLAPL